MNYFSFSFLDNDKYNKNLLIALITTSITILNVYEDCRRKKIGEYLFLILFYSCNMQKMSSYLFIIIL